MTKKKNSIKRRVTMIIMAILMLAAFAPSSQSANVIAADDRTIPERLFCRFEYGRTLMDLQSTDYFYYWTRSKSALANPQRVNSTMSNSLLAVSGFDFNEPNEAILGREIRPTSIPEEPIEGENENAPRVSAFDRFGMAGLTWSSYQGEFKFNYVDTCAKQDRISPTEYGNFYQGRLFPQSTHNEVSTSRDPRSIQFDKGLLSHTMSALADVFANMIFSVAKGVVTLTIVFVGLAFTDITVLMGMSADGSAGPTAAGIFMDIYSSIFSGFVLIAISFTAIYLIYNGLVKRQFRFAINSLGKTIAIFAVAVIMATNPTYWIGMPNRVATYGQAVILNSMTSVYEGIDSSTSGNASLCKTDVGSIYDNVELEGNESKLMSEFEKINSNMRSVIGCKLWEEMLFKPWVKGQFGTEYENLYDKKLDNINKEWVGDAAVPLGGGDVVNNWALFFLSSQTDAHSQVGEQNFPTIINGLNADWWRTADALSNYDEYEEISEIGGAEHANITQVDSNPTDYWQSWVGNNQTERMGVAFVALAFAVAGSAAPLVFSLSSAVFGFGITLLMMISPMFFLFGLWGGKGEGIFFGWLSSLANTIMKRIGVSILLVLSLMITIAVMDLVYKIGFIKAFVLMIMMTSILIKNKDKILDMLASIDFGGTFDPRTRANQAFNTSKRTVGDASLIGVAGVAGGVAGIKSGVGVQRGAEIASKRQLRNTLYKSKFGMQVARETDIAIGGEHQNERICVMCHKMIGANGKELAYVDDENNHYCIICADELGIEDLNEVVIGKEESEKENGPGYIRGRDVRSVIATSGRSSLKHEGMKGIMNADINNEGLTSWNKDEVEGLINDNMSNLKYDMAVFSDVEKEVGRQASPPTAPQPLHEYLDIAKLNMAWTQRDFETVEGSYKDAWKMWYEDNAKNVEEMSEEEIGKFIRQIEENDYKLSLSDEMEALAEAEILSEKKTKIENPNEDLYSTYEGDTIFDKHDINKSKEEKERVRSKNDKEE